METLADIWNLYDLLERERPALREGILMSFRIMRGGRHTWRAKPDGRLVSASPAQVMAFDLYNFGDAADFAIKRIEGGFLLFTASDLMDLHIHTQDTYIVRSIGPDNPYRL